MGFWQGMNAGLNRQIESKARETEQEALRKERMDERERAAAEKAADRAFQRDLVTFQLQESRRDNLLVLLAKQEQEKAAASAVTGGARAFFKRLGEDVLSDPTAQALLNNPTLAAELEKQVTELELFNAKNDLDKPPLTGQTLLDLSVVYDVETGRVAPSGVTLDDLLSMDMSDRSSYEKLNLELSQTKQPSGYAKIKPEAFRVPDPARLEEGRATFDQQVLREANKALLNPELSVDEATKLQASIAGYKDENSAERMQLQDQFGYSVFKDLLANDNRYVTALKDDPQFSIFNDMYQAEAQLRAIMADPESSPADIAGANALLTSLGIN